MLSAASSQDTVSTEAFWGYKSSVTGLASTARPTAEGMERNMVVFIAVPIRLLVPAMSPWAKLPEMPGIIAEDMAEAMAMGMLAICFALPLNRPYWV